jgi:hypothetical protein
MTSKATLKKLAWDAVSEEARLLIDNADRPDEVVTETDRLRWDQCLEEISVSLSRKGTRTDRYPHHGDRT